MMGWCQMHIRSGRLPVGRQAVQGKIMMIHGDRIHKETEDGDVFELEAIRHPSWSMTILTLVPNPEIVAKSQSLLLVARAMAKSRSARARFLAASVKSLDLAADRSLINAEAAAEEAADRLSRLDLLAQGLSWDGRRVVTMSDWIELLLFFKQTPGVGRVVLPLEMQS